jgi:PAS domain S-box-containing protein
MIAIPSLVEFKLSKLAKEGALGLGRAVSDLRDTFGKRGLTAVAATVGLVLASCVASIAGFHKATDAIEQAHADQHSRDILQLQAVQRPFMRNIILEATGGPQQEAPNAATREAMWRSIQAKLEAMCGGRNRLPASLIAICDAGKIAVERMNAEPDALRTGAATPALLESLVMLSSAIATASVQIADKSDLLVVHLLYSVEEGKWLLTLCTASFLGAFVFLFAMAGRASYRAHQLRLDHESLIDSLSDTVFELDVQTGHITYLSAAASELFGFPPHSLLGSPLSDLISKGDLADQRLHALLKAPEGQTHQLCYQIRTFSGATRHVEARFRKVRKGSKFVVAGILRSIEETVQLNLRLEEERSHLRSIVETEGAMVVLTDRDLNILMVNREFERVHGLSFKSVVGKRLTDVIPVKLDPDLRRLWRQGRLAANDLRLVQYAKEMTAPDGRNLVLALSVTPITGPDGSVQRIVAVGIDVTEQRKAEEALIQAERLATLGEMAATVVHEVSQPLQAMSLAGAMAAEEIEEAIESGRPPDHVFVSGKLQTFSEQIARASRMLQDLRSFVRGDAGERPAAFSANDAMNAAVAFTAVAMRKTGTEVATRASEGTATVTGHIGRLEQVLVNLINNARDAGARRIDLRTEEVEEQGKRFVRIRVADDGPGIAETVLKRLFHEFVTTKERGKGTGLGLRICRRIVEEMGGSIAASNQPVGGALFQIVLPAAPLSSS